MHVLLADDSRAVALPMIQFLQERGHQVTFVQDGAAAVEAFRSQSPDLVLLDVVMPVMDGIEATRRIKAQGGARWAPVMLMTSLSAQAEIVAGLDAGADDYLIKPVCFEVLEARMRSMQRIATMQDSLFGIVDNVFEAIVTIDETGQVLSFNKAAERIFGYRPGEIIGQNVRRLMPSPHAERHDGYLARYLREGQPHVIGVVRRMRGVRKNGEIFPIRLSVTEVKTAGGRWFIGLVSDISQEEADRERIEFLALHDPLTRLPNRAHFNDALEALLARADGRLHALLFIDLDGFKPINDGLGHEAGDEALRIVAQRLRQSLTGEDLVARLGGDEFVALARDIPDATAALAIGERLRGAISRPLALSSGQQAGLGASVGIALIPLHGQSASHLLTVADNAMYAAKHAGRGRVVLGSTLEAGVP